MSTSFTLFLVRHGNTFESWDTPKQIGVQTDLPLTQTGKDQIKRVSAHLKKINLLPNKFYSGKLRRQSDSAKIIAAELGLNHDTLEYTPVLDELDYGAWEGLTADEIKDSWAKEYDAWERRAEADPVLFPEDIDQRIKSIAEWVSDLRKKHKSKEVVCAITSNGILKLFYSVFPAEWENLRKSGKVDDLKVKPGNFCEIEVFPDKLVKKGWNITP